MKQKINNQGFVTSYGLECGYSEYLVFSYKHNNVCLSLRKVRNTIIVSSFYAKHKLPIHKTFHNYSLAVCCYKHWHKRLKFFHDRYWAAKLIQTRIAKIHNFKFELYFTYQLIDSLISAFKGYERAETYIDKLIFNFHKKYGVNYWDVL